MESTPVPAVVSVAADSLAAMLGDLPDPRRAGSVTYPLPAVLALAVAAMVAGQTSVLAIAQWISRQPPAQREALGFPPGRTPAQTTLHRLFRQLDVASLAALQQATFADVVPAQTPLQGIAIDGKCQRGRLRRTREHYAKHTLCAVDHASGLVLAHRPLGSQPPLEPTELDAAPALIASLDWTHRVLTADGLFCQRHLCAAVQARGGDYLLPVGGNQPRLHAQVRELFATMLPAQATQTVCTEEQGHGRQQDRRVLTVLPIHDNRLAWPGLRQAYQLIRTWEVRGIPHHSVHYGITSLAPERVTPAQLLVLRRGHWTIENRLHRQKDVLWREDASQVHRGAGAAVLSLMRDAAINLYYLTGSWHLAAGTRALAQSPHHALAMACHPLSTHA